MPALKRPPVQPATPPPGGGDEGTLFTMERLLRWGEERSIAFCAANDIPQMRVCMTTRDDWRVGSCAYWRAGVAHVCVPACARWAGVERSRNWNWPGAVTDRTPYGVVCHELGHHVDHYVSTRNGLRTGKYYGDYSASVYAQSGERAITSYCPNDAEWFAEMFRLFVTNHALLYHIRPRTWDLLTDRFEPVSSPDWITALGPNVPERIIATQRRR